MPDPIDNLTHTLKYDDGYERTILLRMHRLRLLTVIWRPWLTMSKSLQWSMSGAQVDTPESNTQPAH